jgi:hypothetical protein
MRKFLLSGLFVALASSALAGPTSCPDTIYNIFPISGVNGGSASSCGNASVTSSTVFAATPGNIPGPFGSVGIDVLEQFLKFDLFNTLADEFVVPGEGSAVLLEGFSAAPGSTISFDWASSFEPGAAGALFVSLNGNFGVLDFRLPFVPCEIDLCELPPDCPSLCAANVKDGPTGTSGQFTLPLGDGPNTLFFGAVVLENRLVRQIALDPSITVTNLAVTSTSDIPEPATLALTGAALLGLAMWRRRRRA